jgi:pyruvate/2-oxoglutarate dehydrogenase complex dihydrolipoamide dehydrogenase (E3) component
LIYRARVLKSFEPELVDKLTDSAHDLGIRIVTNFQACGVQRVNGSMAIHGNKDCADVYQADLVIHGAGRTANLAELNLPAGEIACSSGGVAVNEYLQSVSRIGQKHAFFKVLIEDGNHRILGAHLFGHNSAEAINIFAVAMKFGLTTRDLKKVLWAYPTYSSDIKYMLD